jgi:uncharacterized membrane protein
MAHCAMTTQPHAPDGALPRQVDQHQLTLLREHRRRHRSKRPPLFSTVDERPDIGPSTRGQRLADIVARTVGSWRFISLQSAAIAVWMGVNAWFGKGAWDPYPFILLNLLLSFQAAYTAPAIMMSQNRQSEQDRKHAESDYEINVKAEMEIELLHEKIDLLTDKEILALTEAVRELSAQLKSLTDRNLH